MLADVTTSVSFTDCFAQVQCLGTLESTTLWLLLSGASSNVRNENFTTFATMWCTQRGNSVVMPAVWWVVCVHLSEATLVPPSPLPQTDWMSSAGQSPARRSTHASSPLLSPFKPKFFLFRHDDQFQHHHSPLMSSSLSLSIHCCSSIIHSDSSSHSFSMCPCTLFHFLISHPGSNKMCTPHTH